MTQFRKIVFMDADTIVFRNLDHLFGPEYPMFTAALTYACCNAVAAPIPSGGFWIVEPDVKWCVVVLHDACGGARRHTLHKHTHTLTHECHT